VNATTTWLTEPWAGAALRFIADPATDPDPAALPGWPEWAPLDAVLARPPLRGQLARWLLADEDDDAGLLAHFARPSARLALIPPADALALMDLLAAWLDAPRIAGLIRRNEIEAAKAEIGEEGFAFAVGRAGLFARPGEALLAALALLAGDGLRAQGAALFGLATGALPASARRRLAIRRPAWLWSIAAAHCRDDAAGAEAWACMRRLVRDRAPAWSTWLN
jgi:hypothetical protein